MSSSSPSPKNNQILPLNGTFSPMLFIGGEGTTSPTKNGQLMAINQQTTQNGQHFLIQSPSSTEHQNNMQMNDSSPPPNLIIASTPIISSPPSASSFSLPPPAIISGNSPQQNSSNSSSPNSPSKCQQANNGIDLLQSLLNLAAQNAQMHQNGQSSAIGLLQQLAQHKLEQQQQSQNQSNNRQIQFDPQQMQLFAHQMPSTFGGGGTTIQTPTETLMANNRPQIGGPILTDALREAIAVAVQQQQQIIGQNANEEINMMEENREKQEKNADFAIQLNSLSPILGFNLTTMPNVQSQSSSPPQQTLINNLPNSGHNSAANHSNRPIRSQRAPMKEIITLDDPNELDEFMANGEEQCIQDMRAFITQFSLRQTTVAMMTGVSQPYISKLLNGNHRELSLRCRKNIYCWYLNCRRHPEKLAMFVHDQPISRLETTVDGELVPQRRERYVFRPVLIRILETYFQESPFPDTAKRAEIANACNSNLQLDKKGNQLMPKEVVTPQVVANWFANKRKEMRRKNQRSGGNGNVGGGGRMSQRSGGNIQQFGELANGGGNSSSAASCSSSLSPSPPNSATFGQSNIFNGFEQSNLTALLEEIQNQQQMKGIGTSAGGKNVDEILLAGKQNLILQNLLLQQQKIQQNIQQKPLLSLADCAPLLPGATLNSSSSSSISSIPLQSPIHQNIQNGSLFEHFLLLQQQQNALSMLPTTTFGQSNSNLVDPSQLAALQLAAAAAFINQSPSGNSTSIFDSSINAAKLMENTAAQWAATQNPQLLATFER